MSHFRFWRYVAALLLLLTLRAEFLLAALPAPAHPIVAGFERFFVDPASDTAEGGRLLLGELNCIACHQPSNDLRAQLLTKRAPILSEIGSRVRPTWMKAFLSQPHQTKPGTTMPDVLGHLTAAERDVKVEALVHFLVSTAQRSPSDQSADRAAAQRGDKLFHESGCVACHGARREGVAKLPTSIPLGANPAKKYTIATMTAFLKNPTHVRPSGRMPNLGLKDQEFSDIANYLLEAVVGTPNFTYEHYEANGQKLDDYFVQKPKATGQCFGLDLGVASRKQNFAIVFNGYLRVIDKAEFTFFLNSDDGSRLVIDGVKVVDNDGVHPASTVTGKMILDRGMHRLRVEYFNGGAGAELSLDMQTKDLPRGDVTGAVALTDSSTPPQVDTFRVDPQLATTGRQFFAELGCASCHELKHDNKVVASLLKAPDFATLAARPALDRGCLAETSNVENKTATTAGAAPRFDFNARQLAALRAISTANHAKPADQQVAAKATISNTMLAMNCYACHQRDGRGGPEAERNDYFVTTIKEMGDEGRLPPHLNGVGSKLRTEWFKELFSKGAKDRPYMLTRMPQFGMGNVEPLIAALATVDTFDPLPLPTFDEPPYRVKDQGRFLAGGKAFACIKCHTFGQYKAEGIQSIDMAAMTRRLRPEWFQRYVRDPLTYRPGTRMPVAWPKTGKSFLPTVYDGDSDKQVAAVWTWLLDNERAAAPYGVGGQPIELIPDGEPLIYRNFIEGAGSRAIAVAYPEGVNLAWDANLLRLAIVWKGAFIDASRHWAGRGQGFQSPLGNHVMPLADAVPLAVLADSQADWPKLSPREGDGAFRGYRLDAARRPTFMFDLAGVKVEESFIPEGEAAQRTLRRTLSLAAEKPVANLWHLAAVGTKIEQQADGWYLIDNAWRLRVQAGPSSAAIVRDKGSRQELLVPVTWAGGKSQIVETFAW